MSEAVSEKSSLIGGRTRVAKAFGATLRLIRLEQGLSQDQLSEHCGCDRTYPSLLERGLRLPTLWVLLRIAHGLGVTPQRLVMDTVARLRSESPP